MKSQYAVKIHYLILLLYFAIPGSWSHPQCLDFRPPFESTNYEFCKEYAEFGCCTAADDLAIRKRHSRVVADLENKHGVTGCREYLREIMCLQCHPYAAHVFDAEETQQKRPFPGLCLGFCRDFYDKCSAAIPLLIEDPDEKTPAIEPRDLFCEHNMAPDPVYCYPELNSNEILSSDISREGITTAGCVCLEEIASELRNPIMLRSPPDDTQRIFIAEQKGIVYIYDKNNTREPEPFLDLSSIVLISNNRGDERGFLNLLFHPDYANNRRLFVYYSINIDGRYNTRLSEFLSDTDNPNRINPNSERIVLVIPQPFDNHNGGAMLFGVDGYLYLFLGDGGAGGDPRNYAQNLDSLLGKALRIDVDSTPQNGSEYVIPDDNPFLERSGARPEIYAYGIRNIWRCDVDEGDEDGNNRGRIICADVGQSAYEEIDIILPGKNYGWKTREGFVCYNNNELCGKLGDEEELPIHAYAHGEGRSVTGGHVYRGCMNPNFYGKYIYGDYTNGAMWTLEEDLTTKTWNNSKLTTCGPEVCFNGLTGTYPRNILSFGEDYNGEIYILSTSDASSASPLGKVLRIVDPIRRGDPSTCRFPEGLVMEQEQERTTTSTTMEEKEPTTTSTTMEEEERTTTSTTMEEEERTTTSTTMEKEEEPTTTSIAMEEEEEPTTTSTTTKEEERTTTSTTMEEEEEPTTTSTTMKEEEERTTNPTSNTTDENKSVEVKPTDGEPPSSAVNVWFVAMCCIITVISAVL